MYYILTIVVTPCREVATADSSGNSKSASGGIVKESGINKTTLAAIVSIFSTVLIVCILAVYFHKPERR